MKPSEIIFEPIEYKGATYREDKAAKIIDEMAEDIKSLKNAMNSHRNIAKDETMFTEREWEK